MRIRRRTRARHPYCLLVSSSGGHLLQLKQLEDAWPRKERIWVTFDKTDARSLLADEQVVFAYHPTNRNVKNLIRNFGLAVRLIVKYRPYAVVTTGAGVAVPFCYVGRIFGATIVFIETLARVDHLSLTGRLVSPVANRFFVQWPELANERRKAEYAGTLL